jgi:hypothetical protein
MVVGCSGKVSRNHRVLDFQYPYFSDLILFVVSLGVLGNPKRVSGLRARFAKNAALAQSQPVRAGETQVRGLPSPFRSLLKSRLI